MIRVYGGGSQLEVVRTLTLILLLSLTPICI